MKILFALNEDLDHSLETRILNEYKEQNGYGFEFDKATSLNEAAEKLENNYRTYDLLVLNEELEINNPITLEKLKRIKNISKEMRIILIFNKENKNDDFIKTLYTLEIDFISSEEVTMEKIIGLIMDKDILQVIDKENQKEITSLKNKFKEISIDFNKFSFKDQSVFKSKTLPNTNKVHKNLTIGIGGVSNGSGTTHTTLGLASYLRKIKNKVAIVEFNNKPQLSRLIAYSNIQNKDYFSINKLDIYFQKHIQQDSNSFNQMILKLKSDDYDYIIIDFGELKSLNNEGISKNNISYNELCKSDYQILCLNGSSWKWEDINFFRCDNFAEVEPYINNWILTISLVTNHFFRDIKKEIENITVLKNIKKAPLYLNPFNISEENNEYFKELIKHIIS